MYFSFNTIRVALLIPMKISLILVDTGQMGEKIDDIVTSDLTFFSQNFLEVIN